MPPLTSDQPLRAILPQIALLAIRMAMTLSKFLLAIYTARFLSLADLGVYGLLIGATTIAPAVSCFGMTDWLIRTIVDRPSAEVVPLVTSRLALTFAVHLLAQPLLLGFIIAAKIPIPLPLAAACGVILLLDNLANDASDILIARRHVFLANGLMFLRQGLWPLPVIVIGFFHPPARTLEFLLGWWILALALTCLLLLALLFRNGRWRHVGLRLRWLVEAMRGSLVLYVKDASSAVSAFIDRFLISLFLGLELTGVYTLFWSIANVAHSLSVFGVLQTHIARIVGAGQEDSAKPFREIERKLQRETGAWTLALAAAAAVATPVLLILLERPQLDAHLTVFWVILLATLLRVAADGYGFALLALHRDRAIALIALGGALASAALNAVLAPTVGIMGAAIAYVITAAGMFIARYVTCQAALSAKRQD